MKIMDIATNAISDKGEREIDDNDISDLADKVAEYASTSEDLNSEGFQDFLKELKTETITSSSIEKDFPLKVDTFKCAMDGSHFVITLPGSDNSNITRDSLENAVHIPQDSVVNKDVPTEPNPY